MRRLLLAAAVAGCAPDVDTCSGGGVACFAGPLEADAGEAHDEGAGGVPGPLDAALPPWGVVVEAEGPLARHETGRGMAGGWGAVPGLDARGLLVGAGAEAPGGPVLVTVWTSAADAGDPSGIIGTLQVLGDGEMLVNTPIRDGEAMAGAVRAEVPPHQGVLDVRVQWQGAVQLFVDRVEWSAQ